MKTIFVSADDRTQVYYYYQNNRRYLLPVGDRVLIGLKSEKTKKEKMALLNELDVDSSVFDSTKSYPEGREFVSDTYIIAHLKDGWQNADKTKIATLLETNPEITFINFFYKPDGPDELISFTLQLFVQTKDKESPEKHQDLLKKYGIVSVDEFDPEYGVFLLSVGEKSDYTALEAANGLHESDQFVYAEPNFFRLAKLSQFIPDDDFYDEQWYLPNVGMPNAWPRSKGDGIRIAIMDVMVSANHDDLAPNMVTGYDPTGMPIGFDTHGTQVAGVAAARGDNDLGIAGVAFEATIIPVRIGFAPAAGSPVFISNETWVVEAFNRCRQQSELNADVINCSFGWNSPTNTLTNAITNAATNGRGGLGCVICAATGNDNTSVAYPASHTSVIGVGATNGTGHKASFSNYGTGIDLSAPGTDIVTTTPPNNYTLAPNTIDGTSFASPAVAGAAALILTVYPNASPNWVRNILRSTADRTGGYSYVGGWSSVSPL
ncbi:S8 family peptidase [Parapedobacter sp. 10938]|uniref:S8 family peptidase n=1 Tax=Parapedobacter flavus TaxID=3110225 RepID=UPI002DB96326|nr:S8 family serine peptidase [Parapedobacter sp. 10938]MEC3881784.1 S8 family serine peptidase [Parapedobacter sp. 10938]